MSLVTLFPFFIVAAAIAHLLGQSQDAMLTVANILHRLPPNVADTLRARDRGAGGKAGNGAVGQALAAQVSRRVTMRLKTGWSDFASTGSRKK